MDRMHRAESKVGMRVFRNISRDISIDKGVTATARGLVQQVRLVIPIITVVLLLAGVAHAGGIELVSDIARTDSVVHEKGNASQNPAGEGQGYDDTVWPTIGREIASPFGPRLQASENYRYDFHRGIDIPGEQGEPIISIADGEIFRTYFDGNPNNPYQNSGNVVIVRHTTDTPFFLHGASHSRYYSLYMHLDSILVQTATAGGPYQQVAKGQTIGTLGHSGGTSFDNLHLEIRIGTTCSLEYQISHPEASCSTYFGSEPRDPHVNPLAFLSYPDLDSLQVELIQTQPLRFSVRSDRDELDFNQILVGHAGNEFLLDFNERVRIDTASIDNNSYMSTVILPGQFNTASQQYEIVFEFEELDNFDFIEARDIWGKSVRLTNPGPVNALPVIEAAASTSRAAVLRLAGSVSADSPGSSGLTVIWSQVSGPSVASIIDPNSAETNAVFTVPGTYVFRLTASEGELSTSDEVTIEVVD